MKLFVLIFIIFLNCSTTRTLYISCSKNDKIEECVKAQLGKSDFRIVSYVKVDLSLYEVKIKE